MKHQLNMIVDYFIDNIDKDIVILTDYEHFLLFDDKEKGVDLELQLNTYISRNISASFNYYFYFYLYCKW